MDYDTKLATDERIHRGGQGVWTPPPALKNHKNKEFLSNSGQDPLKIKIKKASKPAFNAGPSSARKGNAISMAFRWRASGGPLVVVFGPAHPSSPKKALSKLDPL